MENATDAMEKLEIELVCQEKDVRQKIIEKFSKLDKTISLNSNIQNNIKSELRQKLLNKIMEKRNKYQTELNELYKRYNTIEPQLAKMKQKWEEIRDYENLVCSTLENEYA